MARLAFLAVMATLSGLLEAIIFIFVVAAAVGVATDQDQPPLEVPIMTAEASPQDFLWVAVICALLVLALHAVVAEFSSRLSRMVLESIRIRAVSRYLEASWPAQAKTREGALQESISSLAIQSANLTSHFANSVTAAFTLVVLVFAALLVDVITMAIVLGLGTTLFALIRPISHLTHRRSSRYVASTTELAEDVGRLASLTMELRVFGVQEKLKKLLIEQSRTVGLQYSQTKFVSTFGSHLYRDLAILFLVLSVGGLTLVGGTRLASIGSVVLLALRSLGYATSLQNEIQAMNEYSPHLFLVDARLKELAGAKESHGETSLANLGVLSLQDVGYRYESGTVGLRDISLHIRHGETIGIIGPSGSGKSTLLQVLMRLRLPTTGSVLVNGTPYEEIAAESWAHLLSLVPQEPKLMEASISDNIRFMRREPTEEEIELAADAAHVGDEVRQLPGGFSTKLGPRGSGLSGGQKQRITIARALLGRPEMLLMDEPTSALDDVSERKMQETIRQLKGKMTIVIVAHRRSTLEVCDRLITLEDGAIAMDERRHSA